VLGTLIHEATHRVSHASDRTQGFMSEAIAHFAEQDFYKLMYGPSGPLQGRSPASANIQKMLALSDEELFAEIELAYRTTAPKGKGDIYIGKGVTADQVLKELFADIAADYKKSSTPIP
jgi:hypothetical protein